jgi:hypothetical protein
MGRYQKVNRDACMRPYCKTTVQSEFHFLLICTLYDNIRTLYIDKKYYEMPDMNKFNALMSSSNENIVKNTAIMLYKASKTRDTFVTNRNL